MSQMIHDKGFNWKKKEEKIDRVALLVVSPPHAIYIEKETARHRDNFSSH